MKYILIVFSLLLSFSSASAEIVIKKKSSTATVYTDDFNRTDGSLGSNWTRIVAGSEGVGELKVASNTVYELTYQVASMSYYSGGTFNANQYAEIDYANNTVPDINGVGVRLNSSGNGYFCAYYNGTAFGIYKLNAGVRTLLGSGATVSYAQGDRIRCQASGTSTTTITAYINDSQVDSQTDSSSPYTSGYPGIVSHGQKPLDNFEAGDL